MAPSGDDSQLSKQERAQRAMHNRSKKENVVLTQYYYVIAGFCVICLVAVFMTVFNPKPKLSDLEVLSQEEILIHNGQGHQFTHGENEMF